MWTSLMIKPINPLPDNACARDLKLRVPEYNGVVLLPLNDII